MAAPSRGLWWAGLFAILFFSGIVVLAGVLFTVIAMIGLLDPAGAKMADDSDPFGPPPTTVGGIFVLCLSLGILLSGILAPAAYCHFLKKPKFPA